MSRIDVLTEQFSLAQEVEGGVVRLRLSGELDLATVPLLVSELEGATQQAIVLDLEELTFIDIAGLRAVLSAEHRARERQQQLTLVDGSRPVRRLLELTGFEPLFDGEDRNGTDDG